MEKLIVPIFLLILVSCKNAQQPESMSFDTVTGKLSYLALGDSYTIGESVEPQVRWPVQLVDTLRESGITIASPDILARTGWTTTDLLSAMGQKLNDKQYDLVSVSIGVNNQYQSKSPEEYEQELFEIFKKAVALSKNGKRGVFAVSIPDYGATPFGSEKSEEIAEEIGQFNGIFKRTAEAFGINFYNITPVSRRAKAEPDLTASDQLHPSGKMYSLWVKEFAGEIIKKIKAF